MVGFEPKAAKGQQFVIKGVNNLAMDVPHN
jgi:hypothetical protein